MSAELSGDEVDVRAITDAAAAPGSGVAHAAGLVAFADAVVGSDDAALDRARRALLESAGPEALVDAAAVVGNFQRMVRIADATGIPLDAPVALMSEDLRRDLGLGRFAASANTREPSAVGRGLGALLRPLAPRAPAARGPPPPGGMTSPG